MAGQAQDGAGGGAVVPEEAGEQREDALAGQVGRLEEAVGEGNQGQQQVAQWGIEEYSVEKEELLLEALARLKDELPERLMYAWLNDKTDIAASFTRRQFWDHTRNLAALLATKHGVKTGDRVIVLYPPGIDFFVAFVACLHIGAVVVSVYPPNPKRLSVDLPKLKHFVTDSGSRVVLTTAKYRQVVKATSIMHSWPSQLGWIVTDDYTKNAKTAPQDFQGWHEPSPTDSAFIQYTSGSTGAPKGIVVTHRNVAVQMYGMRMTSAAIYHLDFDQGFDYVSWLPQFHDLGLFFNYMLPCATRITSYLFSPVDFLRSPLMWLKAIDRYNPAFISGANFAFGLAAKRLQAAGKVGHYDLSSVKLAAFGGEPTQSEVFKACVDVLNLDPKVLCNGYGLAEHSLTIVFGGQRICGDLVSAGVLSTSREIGYDIRVVGACQGDHFAELPENQHGEVVVQSMSVANGYWQRPDATAEAFHAKVLRLDGTVGEYLRTGDIGFISQDDLFITARLKDLIIIGGRNFAPIDIEVAAERVNPDVIRPGSTIAFQGSEEGCVILCEVRNAAASRTAGVSLRHVADSIRVAVAHSCEVKVEHVVLLRQQSVPKTTSGKVQRNKGRKMWQNRDFKQGQILCDDNTSEETTGQRVAEMNASNLEELIKAMDASVDVNKTLLENGWASMQVAELTNAAQQRLDLSLDYAHVDSLAVKDLIAEYSRGGASFAKTKPTVFLPPKGAGVQLRPVPLARRIVYQVLVLCALFASVLAATLPSVYYVKQLFDETSRWWWVNGRSGPLVLLAVVIWMVSYTLLCIVLKWILIGRQQPRYTQLWSFRFACMMLVERQWAVWHGLIGGHLVDTPWLTLVYVLLGVRAHISTRFGSVVTSGWDMVTVGSHSVIDGTLLTRIYDSTGVHYATTMIGKRVTVGGGALVYPYNIVPDEICIAPLAMVPPNTILHGPKGSSFGGNPVRDVPEKTDSLSEAPSLHEPWQLTRFLAPGIVLVTIATIVFAISVALPAPAQGASEQTWTAASAWLVLSNLVVFFVTGVALFLAAVLLKWTFVSPFLTDRFAGLSYTTFLPFLYKSSLVKWWHRMFGMTIGRNSHVLCVDSVSPSKAHLVSVGKNCMVFNCQLVPRDSATLSSWLSGATPNPWSYQPTTVIGDNADIMLGSRLEGFVTVEHGAGGVTAGTRLTSGAVVETGTAVTGNPANLAIPLKDTKPVLSHSARLVLLREAMYVTHVTILAAVVFFGLEILRTLPIYDWSAYASVPVAVFFALSWLMFMLWLEMFAYKRLVMGRIRKETIDMNSSRAVKLHMTQVVVILMTRLLSPFFAGTFVANMIHRSFGVHVGVFDTFVNNAMFEEHDADLIRIGAGAIIDQAYVLAHLAGFGKIIMDEVVVGRGAVIHPRAVLFLKSLGEGGQLLACSKLLREIDIKEQEIWVGLPAECYMLADTPESMMPNQTTHSATAWKV